MGYSRKQACKVMLFLSKADPCDSTKRPDSKFDLVQSREVADQSISVLIKVSDDKFVKLVWEYLSIHEIPAWQQVNIKGL